MWDGAKKIDVRVYLDLTKPLARGRTVTLMGGKFWVSFHYKKMPKICFSCGCIVHVSEK